MKNKFLKQILFSALIAFMLSACGTRHNAEGAQENDGNNNNTYENDGNHPNTPANAPGTEYPGSAGDSSNQITDTVHLRR